MSRERGLLAGVDLGCRAKNAGNGLEACFGDMMVVGAVMVQDMQRDAGILGQRLKEFAHKLGVECADLRRGEVDIPHKEGTAGNIHGSLGHRLIHGKIERGVAGNAAPVTQRLRDGLADGDAGIFDRMVIIDMQVTLNLDIHVDQRMAAQLVQHMIEKSHPGGNCRLAGAVDIHAHRNRGFVGLADDLAFTFCHLWPLRENVAVPYQHETQISSCSIVLNDLRKTVPCGQDLQS